MKNTMQSLEQAIKEFNEELAMYKKDYITIQAVLESGGSILFEVMDSIESWYRNDYRRELRNAKSRYKYAVKQGNKEKANKEFNAIMEIEYMERYIPVVITRFNYALDCYKATDVLDRITYNMGSTEDVEPMFKEINISKEHFKHAFEDMKEGHVSNKTSAIIQKHVGYILKDCDYINLNSDSFIYEINEALLSSLDEEDYKELVSSLADEIVVESVFYRGRTVDVEEAIEFVEKNRLHVEVREAVIAIKERRDYDLNVCLSVADYRKAIEDHACLIDSKASAIIYSYIWRIVSTYHPSEIGDKEAGLFNTLLSNVITKADHALLMSSIKN